MSGKTKVSKGPKVSKVSGNMTDDKLLELLELGFYPAQIAKKYGLTKGSLSKKLKILRESGAITLISKYPQIYRVNKVSNVSVESGKSLEGPLFSMHNIGVRFEILEAPQFSLGPKTKMKNWQKEIKKLDGATIERTTKAILIYPKVDKKAPIMDLMTDALNLANLYAVQLQNQIPGLKLAHGKIFRKPHFKVEDENINQVVRKYEGYTVETGSGHYDDSLGTGTELEFGPDDAVEFAKMPQYLKTICILLQNLDNLKCSFCNQKSISIIYGFSVCKDHRALVEKHALEFKAKVEEINKIIGVD